MGMGAAIVLAGVVFAFVHFSSRLSHPAFTGEKSWAPVLIVPRANQSGVKVAGTFGAWRLLCRNVPNLRMPGASESKHLCAVALVMRNRGTKEWLNLRFLKPGMGLGAMPQGGLGAMTPAGPADKPPAGSSALAMLVFAQRDSAGSLAGPAAARGSVNVRADKHTIKLMLRRCAKGVCFAMALLGPSDLDPVLSAHSLLMRLPSAKPTKSDEVHLPTDDLRAAFEALQRQPA